MNRMNGRFSLPFVGTPLVDVLLRVNENVVNFPNAPRSQPRVPINLGDLPMAVFTLARRATTDGGHCGGPNPLYQTAPVCILISS